MHVVLLPGMEHANKNKNITKELQPQQHHCINFQSRTSPT